MSIRKACLSLLVSLTVVQGCQLDHDVVSPRATPSATSFDPSIVRALRSYDLSPSDLVSDSKPGRVTQKTVTIGQEHVVYSETSGKGPDILLIHGNGQSSNAFARQLSGLGGIFHIIAIDLPGHGRSPRSPNPSTTYQLPGYADLVVQLVKQLNMQHAVIVGWSLGGSILLEAADQLPDVRGLMLIGAPPVSNPFDPSAFLPSPVAGLLFQADLTEDQIQSIVPAFFKPGAVNIPEVFFQDLRIQDPAARLFAGVTLGTGNYKDEVQVVGRLSVPLAVVEGEQEQLTSIAYIQSLTIPTLWHQQIWIVPNAGHIAQFENAEYVNAVLAAFVIEDNSR